MLLIELAKAHIYLRLKILGSNVTLRAAAQETAIGTIIISGTFTSCATSKSANHNDFRLAANRLAAPKIADNTNTLGWFRRTLPIGSFILTAHTTSPMQAPDEILGCSTPPEAP